jgi:hypothetical protein
VSDPFAVTEYDLKALPSVVDRRRHWAFFTRGTDGRPGFGDIWIAHAQRREELRQFTAVDYLARNILSAYEPGRWGFLDLARAVEPGQKTIDVTSEIIARASVLPDPTLADRQSRRLALVTLVDHIALRGARLSRDLRHALVVALELGSRVARRKEASKAVAIEGKRLAKGASVTEAVDAVAGELGISQRKAWEFRCSPLYLARCVEAKAYWSTSARQFPMFTKHHASEAWFVGDTIADQIDHADRVAQAVIDLMRNAAPTPRAGKRAQLAPIDLRWDVLNLLEGAHRRHHAPSETMRVALDHALGLVDARGQVSPIALAGVVDRESFIAMAGLEASFSQRPTDQELLDARRPGPVPDRFPDLRRTPLYRTAVEILRGT